MGPAFPCHLDIYFRTIVYGLPRHVVHEGEFPPAILCDTGDFRAAIVTDPLTYLSESDFSSQFRSDKNSLNLARDKLEQFAEDANPRVFIVIQIRQALGSFPTVDGQCIQIEEESALVNCGGPHVPSISDSTNRINAVLAAIKIELDIADGLDKHLDESIYVTDDGQFVHWLDVQFSASVSVTHPIDAEDLTANAAGARALVGKINQVIAASADSSDMSPERRQNIAKRLADLIHALQLDPTQGDAYRRLWSLQLWDRAEKYGKALKPRLQLRNDHDLQAEKDHRDDIAHPGVERADGALLRSFQQKLFGIIRDHI